MAARSIHPFNIHSADKGVPPPSSALEGRVQPVTPASATQAHDHAFRSRASDVMRCRGSGELANGGQVWSGVECALKCSD
jgi:hypothetical protein